MNFSEKDKKVTVTIGLIMALMAATFFLGVIWERNQSLHIEVEASKEFTNQEVNGLRSDWERNNKIVKEWIDALRKQNEDLKKEMKNTIKEEILNHEKIYHK